MKNKKEKRLVSFNKISPLLIQHQMNITIKDIVLP